jgi:hypothetical protein
MSTINLKAHFDGTSIQLDEPFDLPQNTPLIVTVLFPTTAESSLQGWADLSANGIARAFGDDEPEYSVADIVP